MDTTWQINHNVLSSKIDDEAILMSIEAESYFGLDPVGSRIWELLSNEPATTDELVEMLMDEYDVDKATCSMQAQQFVEEMFSKNLIQKVAVFAA